jgi:glycosyltransferase involved in cell wall biosynthesis
VVEAMAAGLPVVGTDIPGIREALGPDGISFLAPPSDSECLAQKIFGLMTEPGLSQEYGGKLRGRAAKEFALPMMLEQSVQIIAGFFTQLSMSE